MITAVIPNIDSMDLVMDIHPTTEDDWICAAARQHICLQSSSSLRLPHTARAALLPYHLRVPTVLFPHFPGSRMTSKSSSPGRSSLLSHAPTGVPMHQLHQNSQMSDQ